MSLSLVVPICKVSIVTDLSGQFRGVVKAVGTANVVGLWKLLHAGKNQRLKSAFSFFDFFFLLFFLHFCKYLLHCFPWYTLLGNGSGLGEIAGRR